VNDVSERIAYRHDIEKGLAFDLNTMVPLGLLLNELITNSFKHAFTGRERADQAHPFGPLPKKRLRSGLYR
jgi:two-component sensor histidine kinase